MGIARLMNGQLFHLKSEISEQKEAKCRLQCNLFYDNSALIIITSFDM